MYEIFLQLLRKKGITTADVSKATGINQSTFANWKKRRNCLSAKNARLVAEYFGVSVDYLMTGQEPEATWDGPSNLPAFTIGELQLLEIYKQLSEEKQADMIKFGQFLLSRQAEERKKSTELSKEA